MDLNTDSTCILFKKALCVCMYCVSIFSVYYVSKFLQDEYLCVSVIYINITGGYMVYVLGV